MTSIEYIRKYKEPRAKIGLRVTYAGHPYRIANTSGDGLKLRSEILCHAKDDLLDYEPAKDVNNATLYRKALQQHGQIAALESELAAAIEALRDVITYDDQQMRDAAMDLITSYDARQSTEVLPPVTNDPPPVIPPERAEAVARINQRHTYYLATIASRHERERKEAEDWYRRAMNEALNSDENGV